VGAGTWADGWARPCPHYFVLALRLVSAEPAALLDALPVRPSRKTLLAAEAALAEVRIVFFAMSFTSFPMEREGRQGQAKSGSGNRGDPLSVLPLSGPPPTCLP